MLLFGEIIHVVLQIRARHHIHTCLKGHLSSCLHSVTPSFDSDLDYLSQQFEDPATDVVASSTGPSLS